MMCIHDDLTRALQVFETLDHAGQVEFMAMAAMETNGFYKHPRAASNWDSGTVEIKAYGIYAEGRDDADAIRNWTRAATRQANRLKNLHLAENLLRAPDNLCGADTGKLREACEIILTDSRDAGVRVAAARILSDLDAHT